MVNRLQNRGFSLAEVMMAAGILAIGFVFIAGVFPVGVKLTAIATEQTIAPIVTDEAFAKIRLYGVDPNKLPYDGYRLFNKDVLPNDLITYLYGQGYADDEIDTMLEDESLYPSADMGLELKRYNWSVLCRRVGVREVYVIVFVSRKTGAGARYYTHESDYTLSSYGQAVLDPDEDDLPVPVKVRINVLGPKRLETVASGEAPFFNAGCTIADDATGSVYRVVRRTRNDVIVIDGDWRDWQAPLGDYVWVVPPAVMSDGPPVRVGGRNPGIGICQRVVSF